MSHRKSLDPLNRLLNDFPAMDDTDHMGWLRVFPLISCQMSLNMTETD